MQQFHFFPRDESQEMQRWAELYIPHMFLVVFFLLAIAHLSKRYARTKPRQIVRYPRFSTHPPFFEFELVLSDGYGGRWKYWWWWKKDEGDVQDMRCVPWLWSLLSVTWIELGTRRQICDLWVTWALCKNEENGNCSSMVRHVFSKSWWWKVVMFHGS